MKSIRRGIRDQCLEAHSRSSLIIDIPHIVFLEDRVEESARLFGDVGAPVSDQDRLVSSNVDFGFDAFSGLCRAPSASVTLRKTVRGLRLAIPSP